MSPRNRGRTEACGWAEAEARLRQAQSFLSVAELIGDQEDELATPNVAASLAVLAGIAAADAATCLTIGERARGQDHRSAVELVRQIANVGDSMARDLKRLLSVKDEAQYGVLQLSGQRLSSTLRQARHLVEAAEVLLESS